MDAVWIYRHYPNLDHLRYSVRSACRNMKFDRMWIVGDEAPWTTDDVPFIKGNPSTRKPPNVYFNVLLAAECDEMTDDIILMNDDFFVVKEHTPGAEYRSTLEEHIRGMYHQSNWWSESLNITGDYLKANGIKEPLSYELHQPFVMNRAKMAQILRDANHVNPYNPPQWRTLYGNLAEIGGTRVPEDSKKYKMDDSIDPDAVIVSTIGPTFVHGQVGRDVRALFPEPCKYEKE